MPYLPIDPKHVGRTYEAVIRVNSQSGKGGVAYIMKAEHGFDLPRRLQIEFSKTIQTITEDTGTEISPTAMWDAFIRDVPARRAGRRAAQPRDGDRRATGRRVTAQLLVDGEHVTVTGTGNGPIAAFVARAARRPRHRRSTSSTTPSTPSAPGADATAVAYVETVDDDGVTRWGVGTDPNIITASLRAVLSAAERVRRGDLGR